MSLGPRIARVHLGGTTAVSTGTGPVTLWSTRAGGGHTAAPGSAASRKAEQWATVRDHLDGLLTAHTLPVTRATRPVADPPARVDPRQVRRELRAGSAAGLAWWDLGGRLAARRAAADGLDDEVAHRRAQAERAAADAQADADGWWDRLLANDPQVVTDHLDRTLAEHAMPATVTAVEGDRVHLVLPVVSPEGLIGPREPTHTAAGNLSLSRMTKTRRHELYQAAIGSALLAVAAEAFAVAPGVRAVDLAVVDAYHLGGPAVLMLAELTREIVLPDGADRPAIDDVVAAAAAGHATIVRDRGANIGALRALDEHDPEIRALLDTLDVD